MSIFSDVGRVKRPKRTAFDRSSVNKLAFNMGKLVPIYLDEVIPGDKVKLSCEILLRFAPLLAPVMHRVNVYTHFFFVPMRLVWENWASNKDGFITGGREGDSDKVVPNVDLAEILNVNDQADDPSYYACDKGTLIDYLGIPLSNFDRDYWVDNGDATEQAKTHINILPFRAYQLIYNEYYRDQNLEEEVDYGGHGDDVYTDADNTEQSAQFNELMTLRTRAWEKDYFTSALPWAQRGDAVDVPLDGSSDVYLKEATTLRQRVNVVGTSTLLKNSNYSLSPNAAGGLQAYGREVYFDADPVQGDSFPVTTTSQTANVNLDPNGTLAVDQSVNIETLRNALDLQQWLEMNARGGSRYIEQILYHFGIRVPDYQLQRPQYLGGGKSPVSISEVLQSVDNTQGSTSTPLGRQAGHALSVQQVHSFTHWFNEHGYIIGIMSVIPKSCYQQGLPRLFSKLDRFDYFWPEFQHLGEQPIYNKEVALVPVTEVNQDNEAIFGYTPRYAEYKFKASEVHGDFRESLSYWHLGRIFQLDNEEDDYCYPQLNNSFIKCNPESLDRIFPVSVGATDNQTLYANVYFNNKWIRPMSRYGIPRL